MADSLHGMAIRGRLGGEGIQCPAKNRLPSALAASVLLGDFSNPNASNDNVPTRACDFLPVARAALLQKRKLSAGCGIADSAASSAKVSSLLQQLAKRRRRLQQRLHSLEQVAGLIEKKIRLQNDLRRVPSLPYHDRLLLLMAHTNTALPVVGRVKAGASEREVGTLLSFLKERKRSSTVCEVGKAE